MPDAGIIGQAMDVRPQNVLGFSPLVQFNAIRLGCGALEIFPNHEVCYEGNDKTVAGVRIREWIYG